MDIGTFAMLVIVVAFAIGVYSTHKKRSQIYCLFTGKDKTEEQKWVTIRDDCVIFRNHKYDIYTPYITGFWLTKGIHMLFPTRVNCLKYAWYSRFPQNPNTGKYELIDPSVRKVIDKQEWMKSYASHMSPKETKKTSTLMRWLPLVAVVVVVIGAFYLYQNQQSMMGVINSMQQQINAIVK